MVFQISLKSTLHTVTNTFLISQKAIVYFLLPRLYLFLPGHHHIMQCATTFRIWLTAVKSLKKVICSTQKKRQTYIKLDMPSKLKLFTHKVKERESAPKMLVEGEIKSFFCCLQSNFCLHSFF